MIQDPILMLKSALMRKNEIGAKKMSESDWSNTFIIGRKKLIVLSTRQYFKKKNYNLEDNWLQGHWCFFLEVLKNWIFRLLYMQNSGFLFPPHQMLILKTHQIIHVLKVERYKLKYSLKKPSLHKHFMTSHFHLFKSCPRFW